MLRPFFGAVCGLVICAGGSRAFEVEAIIKKVDADKGFVVFTADQKDRAVKAPGDVEVLDAAGKELADGLKAKDLTPFAHGVSMPLTLAIYRPGW